jgi:large subunit ribosomal protein L3
MKALLGKKIGMTRIFAEDGSTVPVTIVEAGPCFVSQIKTKDVDGYNALQLGFSEQKASRVTKPLIGHFEKASLKPLRHLKEFRLSSVDGYELGQELTVATFTVGELVNVVGVSKGKGHAGVMKRHNFSGARKTHGQKDRWRAPGSIGNASDPARVFPGKRMAGRMGGERITMKNLDVVKIDEEKNLLFLRGSVPGAKNGILEIVFNA